uniref:Uncharacterized protein n=1 Tax=Arundo donax TaxID=35708 RepID=A0A0A9FYM2_ARUDO
MNKGISISHKRNHANKGTLTHRKASTLRQIRTV